MNEFFKKPVVKILMLKGEKGDKGDTGEGFPKGGKTGQYLQKKTDADYDYEWSAITTVSWDNVSGKTNATTSASGLMSAEDKAKLDNLQVGGRNLYLGTKDFSGSSWISASFWSKKEEYNGLTVLAGTLQWNGLAQNIVVKAGETYTFSCYVKNADTNAHIIVINTNYSNPASTSLNYKNIEKSTDFKKLSLTFSILSDGVICPRVESDAGDGEICICGLKLERGTVATDWTPAPEDVENEIKELNSVTKSFTLTANNWIHDSGLNMTFQNINDPLITETSNQEVIPDMNITPDQMKAFQKANIIGYNQSAGVASLRLMGTQPSIDIPITVIFHGNK